MEPAGRQELLESDPLALDPGWDGEPPLLSLSEALEQTVLASGLSREQLLARLLEGAPAPLRLPLLTLLPRPWRQHTALVPQQLRQLAALLGNSLLSPTLLAALVDDLSHLLPVGPSETASALARWQRPSVDWNGREIPLPTDLEALLGISAALDAAMPEMPTLRPAPGSRSGHPGSLLAAAGSAVLERFSGGLQWHNQGLDFTQSDTCRLANQCLAQVFNRLGSNLLSGEESPWRFEGCTSGISLIRRLRQEGFRLEARLRASIASFGLGASLVDSEGSVHQVPLALPIRTGLLDRDAQEQRTLLPHAALQLELTRDDLQLRLQYYQGTEGLCGWQGLNDLQRPWQNDAEKGTVRFVGEPFSAEQLEPLLALTEVIALLHNRQADAHHLRLGGYGALGFCLDTTALLQQAMQGRCDLFPLLLGGLWRERLEMDARELAGSIEASLGQQAKSASGPWLPLHQDALESYRRAMAELPLDLAPQGSACDQAWRRLLACLPPQSPFLLVQELPQREPADAG